MSRQKLRIRILLLINQKAQALFFELPPVVNIHTLFLEFPLLIPYASTLAAELSHVMQIHINIMYSSTLLPLLVFRAHALAFCVFLSSPLCSQVWFFSATFTARGFPRGFEGAQRPCPTRSCSEAALSTALEGRRDTRAAALRPPSAAQPPSSPSLHMDNAKCLHVPCSGPQLQCRTSGKAATTVFMLLMFKHLPKYLCTLRPFPPPLPSAGSPLPATSHSDMSGEHYAAQEQHVWHQHQRRAGASSKELAVH